MKRLIAILTFVVPLLIQGQTISRFAPGEYWNSALSTAGNLYAYSGSSTPSIINPAGKLIAGVTCGFNKFKVATTDNLYYSSTAYNATLAWTNWPTDTTGAALNDVIDVMASWADATVILRADSSLWLTDNDSVGIVHALGTQYVITQPIKLSQAGVKYKKVVIGSSVGILGLTNDGKIYRWARNSQTITPTLVWNGRPALDIATGESDAYMAVIQNATGDPTCGHLFVSGTSWGDWGGAFGITYSSLTDIQSIYSVPNNVKKVAMNRNSMHFIDSAGRMWGIAKCNSQGELGNGEEFVNQYTYSTFPGYGWTFTSSENPVAAPAVEIGAGIKWKNLYTGQFFCFYNMATDSNNVCYAWGRNKANCQFQRYLMNTTTNNANPNSADTTLPGVVFPFTQTMKTVGFTAPTLTISQGNQNISVPTATVTAAGNRMLLINVALSTDTIRTTSVTYLWQITSGSGVITNPTAASTTITGLTNGVTTVTVLRTDNTGGTMRATNTITVTNVNQISFKAGCRLILSN